MIRLLLRLLKIQDFEVCASCETLKQQLLFERDEKKRLTVILIEIIKPKTVESVPVEIQPIAQSSALFSRRRSALEAQDRERARILKEGRNIGQPDNIIKPAAHQTIDELEKELGVVEEA